eukprot:6218841-Amphidinium_carterae.1
METRISTECRPRGPLLAKSQDTENEFPGMLSPTMAAPNQFSRLFTIPPRFITGLIPQTPKP